MFIKTNVIFECTIIRFHTPIGCKGLQFATVKDNFNDSPTKSTNCQFVWFESIQSAVKSCVTNLCEI